MSKQDYYFPPDLYYDKNTHMWVKKNTDNQAVIGMDAIGLDNLGDLAYITLHPEGTRAEKGDSLGTLEAAKMTGDLFAPVSGVIKALNRACMENPGLVNADMYGKGWLLTIEVSDWERESALLISGDELQPWIEAEIKYMDNRGFDI